MHTKLEFLLQKLWLIKTHRIKSSDLPIRMVVTKLLKLLRFFLREK